MDTRFGKQNTRSRCCAVVVPSVEILPAEDAVILLAVSLCAAIVRIMTQIW